MERLRRDYGETMDKYKREGREFYGIYLSLNHHHHHHHHH
jgi:hypothetical protein